MRWLGLIGWEEGERELPGLGSKFIHFSGVALLRIIIKFCHLLVGVGGGGGGGRLNILFSESRRL